MLFSIRTTWFYFFIRWFVLLCKFLFWFGYRVLVFLNIRFVGYIPVCVLTRPTFQLSSRRFNSRSQCLQSWWAFVDSSRLFVSRFWFHSTSLRYGFLLQLSALPPCELCFCVSLLITSLQLRSFFFVLCGESFEFWHFSNLFIGSVTFVLLSNSTLLSCCSPIRNYSLVSSCGPFHSLPNLSWWVLLTNFFIVFLASTVFHAFLNLDAALVQRIVAAMPSFSPPPKRLKGSPPIRDQVDFSQLQPLSIYGMFSQTLSPLNLDAAPPLGPGVSSVIVTELLALATAMFTKEQELQLAANACFKKLQASIPSEGLFTF